MWEIGHLTCGRLPEVESEGGTGRSENPRIGSLSRCLSWKFSSNCNNRSFNSLFCKDKPSMAEIILSKWSDFSWESGQGSAIADGALNKNNDVALFAATLPMMSYIMCICLTIERLWICVHKTVNMCCNFSESVQSRSFMQPLHIGSMSLNNV